MSTRLSSSARWWIFALLLLALGSFLRGYDLDHNPPGLWQDEASTGVDAFLLWHTGKDRAGEAFPLIARSFGDYPLALYRYLLAPLTGLFGLSIALERSVSATAGSLLLLFLALLMRRRMGDTAALGGLLSAAFCPTWIHFSRYGSEAILMPFCLVLGWWLFEQKRPWAYWASAVALAASAYTYHAIKLFLPLWVLGFLLFQQSELQRLWRTSKVNLIGPTLLFTALVLPSVHLATTDGGLARGQTVLAWYHYSGLDLPRVILGNYLSYFDPGMVFVRGGPAVAQSIPGLGIWNLVELPLLLVGLATMFRFNRALAGFALFWFLLGPLPGGVTYETHNIGRAIGWIPAPQLFIGFGLARSIEWIHAHAEKRLLPALSALSLLFGWMFTGGYVFQRTLVHYPLVTQRDWQFEISGALVCARELRADELIIVSPGFQVAPVFAQFFFADLAPVEAPIWRVEARQKVAQDELYAFPARETLPSGVERCRITNHRTGQVAAYVYGPAERRLRPLSPAIPQIKLPAPLSPVAP